MVQSVSEEPVFSHRQRNNSLASVDPLLSNQQPPVLIWVRRHRVETELTLDHHSEAVLLSRSEVLAQEVKALEAVDRQQPNHLLQQR